MSANRLTILRDRAAMLSKARRFFHERGLLEVDCPMLSSYASVDAHIDLIPTKPHGGVTFYLHSSPEYGMKRLLSEGIGDIYQLSHVFRNGESGHKHNPEFMMAEWYRLGFSFQELIQETLDFTRLFLGDLPSTVITYREAFQRYAGFDYLAISENELVTQINRLNIELYPSVIAEGKEAMLNLVLGTVIEPKLGEEGLCALAYYPASQAALAKTCWHGDEEVGERFEVYYKGVELANGYHELTDVVEQRRRLVEANTMRKKLGKDLLPLDERFLQALEQGLPECCGVAVGFDRLMMLRSCSSSIEEVMPYVWDNA
ncbi:MAG: EF-P lysine aminoacylase GenX [Parachlamydiaceae bacterium]|nr:EF-P lysine aminoacylase GenX [Parachlamydiaceae bacterium]